MRIEDLCNLTEYLTDYYFLKLFEFDKNCAILAWGFVHEAVSKGLLIKSNLSLLNR